MDQWGWVLVVRRVAESLQLMLETFSRIGTQYDGDGQRGRDWPQRMRESPSINLMVFS
jgi:hypothetical protein